MAVAAVAAVAFRRYQHGRRLARRGGAGGKSLKSAVSWGGTRPAPPMTNSAPADRAEAYQSIVLGLQRAAEEQHHDSQLPQQRSVYAPVPVASLVAAAGTSSV